MTFLRGISATAVFSLLAAVLAIGVGAAVIARSPDADASVRASSGSAVDTTSSEVGSSDRLDEATDISSTAGRAEEFDPSELRIANTNDEDGTASSDSGAPLALAFASDDLDATQDSSDSNTVSRNASNAGNASNSAGEVGTTTSPSSGVTSPGSSTAQTQAAGSSSPQPQSPQSPATTAPANSGSGPATTTAPVAQSGEWCSIEVGEPNSTLRWNDDGKTAVFRLNDAWFNTPADNANELVITTAVDANDNFVMRLWGGGGSTDVACTFRSAAPAATTAALPAPITVPSGHVQMGFSADLWGTDREQYWADLEAVPGAGRLIAHEFKSFTRPIRTDVYRWHLESGRDLLLTWNGTDATDILNGSHDEWIREHARELSSLPGTVMLRFWHEPDVSFKREWIDNDPQQFIDSWNYVRAIFAEEQATNIEWVWCPTAWNWNEQGARYYPGDDAVDWICSDGYSGWDLDAPLGDIADAYTDFQAWADQRPHKPILIAEFGAGQRGPGDRAEWVEGITDWVAASSNIRAVVYFDIDMRPHGEIYDWRLRTESDAWEAMMDVMTSAPFGQ